MDSRKDFKNNTLAAFSGFGGQNRPARVAVVGSGPSGFYAASSLFRTEGLCVKVDVFDRLPTPFGLARAGIAPDHPQIKAVIKQYEKTASHPDFRFFGNVTLGRDVSVDDLLAHYDSIVYAVGAEGSRPLGVPGERLAGVHTAADFVGWYNGHPDCRNLHFDLESARRVAVVGNGNVATDIVRILAQRSARLAATDIADHARHVLDRSGVREILLLGRRGPAQAAFSPKEISEIIELEEVEVVVDPAEAAPDELSAKWLANGATPNALKNVELLFEQSQRTGGRGERTVHCRFLVSPVAIIGEAGRVTRIRLERNVLAPDHAGILRPRPTGEHQEEEVDLVLVAVGFRGFPIPGVPFDGTRGVIPNRGGRVLSQAGGSTVLPGQYVVGWAKRGAVGLMGANNKDAKDTIELLAEDLAARGAELGARPEQGDVVFFLKERGIDYVTFEDWQRLDAYEVRKGAEIGKVRQKLTSRDDIMRIVNELRPA